MSSYKNDNIPRFGGSSTNWVFIAIVSGIVLIALWQIRSILLLTFAAVILVIFFTIPVRRLTKITIPVNGGVKIRRPLAILLSVIGVIAVMVVLMVLIGTQTVEQFATLINKTIPEGVVRVIDWWDGGRALSSIPFLGIADQMPILDSPAIQQEPELVGLGRLGIANVVTWWPNPAIPAISIDETALQNIVTQILNALGQVGGSVLPLVGGVANFLLSLLIVLFISLYLLAEPGRYVDRIILYTPVWYRHRMRTILGRIDEAIRAWLKITGVSMLVAGVLTGLLLAALDIDQWAALGTIAGISSFVPNFGPILALIPALLVGAVQAPDKIGFIVLIVYGVSFIQSQIVAPVLANEDMKLPPVLILVGQIVFGIFFGFLGIMFAVPMTAILLVLLDEIYVKDILGDHQSVPDEIVVEPTLEIRETYGTTQP